MQSKNRITSDEIHLFDVLEILWTGKWVIGVFLVLFLGLGGIISVLVVLVRNALSNRNYSQRIELQNS